MELNTNNHSVFSLHYHLILPTKYRRAVIDDSISERLNGIFVNITPKYNICVEGWEHASDYVCVSFRAEPNSEISKFINAYKSASSRLIKKEFPDVTGKLWQGMFWSQSYCLYTTGEVDNGVLSAYLDSQSEKVH